MFTTNTVKKRRRRRILKVQNTWLLLPKQATSYNISFVERQADTKSHTLIKSTYFIILIQAEKE